MAKMIRNGKGFGYTKTDKVYEPEDRNPTNKGTKAYERKQWLNEALEELSEENGVPVGLMIPEAAEENPEALKSYLEFAADRAKELRQD